MYADRKRQPAESFNEKQPTDMESTEPARLHVAPVTPGTPVAAGLRLRFAAAYLAGGAAGEAPPVFMYISYASMEAAACARCCCLSSGLDSVGPVTCTAGE